MNLMACLFETNGFAILHHWFLCVKCSDVITVAHTVAHSQVSCPLWSIYLRPCLHVDYVDIFVNGYIFFYLFWPLLYT